MSFLYSAHPWVAALAIAVWFWVLTWKERRDPMLVLTRKLGEKIVINGNIGVTIVGIRGDKVRLGIEAPETVPVTRPDAKNQQKPDRAAKPATAPVK